MGQVVRLDEVIRFPLPDVNSREYPYARDLVGELERVIGEEINSTINIILDQVGDTRIFTFGTPDDAGIYPTGTWRIVTTDDYATFERYDGSVWVEKSKLTTGKLFTTGGVGFESVTVTANYTIPDNVYSVTCNATSSINVTLPALTGKRSVVISNNEGKATITMVGTVNGSVNPSLFAGETADLTDNGTEWRV